MIKLPERGVTWDAVRVNPLQRQSGASRAGLIKGHPK